MTIKLSLDQQAAWTALEAFINGPEREHALDGPAGTGKSTLIGLFVDAIVDAGYKVHLAASTNKAARVAGEMSDSKAGTIHSLLGLRPVEDHSKGRMVLKKKGPRKVEPGSLIVVDEASMIQAELLEMIRSAATEEDCKVLFVGDAYQLPPVFEVDSPVFRLVESQSHLTHVHRQALENPIIAAATEFKEVLDGAPFPTIETLEPGIIRLDRDAFNEVMLDAFHSDQDCRTLAWTNGCVRQFNRQIRNSLLNNPAMPVTVGESMIVNSAIEKGQGVIFGTDSTITALDVDAGTVGHVSGYDVLASNGQDEHRIFIPHDWPDAVVVMSEYSKRAGVLEREMKRLRKEGVAIHPKMETERRAAWRQFFEVKRMFADVRPPYASTVHKSQGSTYDAVFVDLDDIGRNTKWYEIARLIYVAMTRAAETVYVTGTLPDRLYDREDVA